MAERVAGTSESLNDLVDSKQSQFQRVIDRVIERALTVADVRRVFGEPVTQGDRTVIPVAKVRTMFGFGGGSGSGPSKDSTEQSSGEGGGGGGSVQVAPLGYIEITPLETRYIPIIDRTRLATTAITCLALVLIVRFRRRKA